MPQLGVNIDHVATLREARGGLEPDPLQAAVICENAGCDSIVVHLRQDRRHINEKDLHLLRETVKTRLNLEMSTLPEKADIALEVKPDQVTFVPEKRQELTTEGGLDVVSGKKKIAKVIGTFRRKGIRTSLFIDPEDSQIEAAKEVGAEFIELHTGRYANSLKEDKIALELHELIDATQLAITLGLRVNAGHGLNYRNVRKISQIKGIEELNIGHAIISQAVLVGLERAVKEMKALL